MELDSKQVTRLPYTPTPVPDNVQGYTTILALLLIGEESSTFFAGQKTAEQAVELIQNRVSLYLKEQG